MRGLSSMCLVPNSGLFSHGACVTSSVPTLAAAEELKSLLLLWKMNNYIALSFP